MKLPPFTTETVVFPEPADSVFPAEGVRAHLCRPVVPSARTRAAIVVLPVTGGDYGETRLFSDHLAAKGFTTLRFERRADWLFTHGDGRGEAREPEAIARLATEYARDVQRGLAWLRARPDVDPARVGILGLSLGAIIASRVAAADPDLRGVVLLIGGAGLADIVLSANDREVAQYRAALSARHGVPEPELAPLLHAAFDPVDNLPDLPRLGRERTLLVTARFDAVVRRVYGDRLWEAAGRPERSLLPCGHYSTVLFVPWLRRRVRRWFEARLLGGL
jgi:dienelactone hydrolase